MSFKLFSIISLIVFSLGLGTIFIVHQFLQINPPISMGLSRQQPARISGWDLYTNASHAFAIQHPSDISVSIPDSQSDENTPSPILHLSTAEHMAITGLDIARADDSIIGITIYTSPDTAHCFEFPTSSSTAALLNNTPFKTATWTDAAMGGERGIIRQYRMVRNATCYILESTIHYRDISFLVGVTGNQPHAASPADIAQQNDWIARQQAIQSRIIKTFSFSQ